MSEQKMSTSASIQKIKIPSLNSNALPRNKKHIETATTVCDLLVDISKMLVRKFKILPNWDQTKSNLFEELKTKSESKCMVELYRLCKKSLRKKSSELLPKENEAKSSKSTSTIFRELKKKKKHSSKKKPPTTQSPVRKKKTDEEAQDNSITEFAQRSA